jgi:hypothetical protein
LPLLTNSVFGLHPGARLTISRAGFTPFSAKPRGQDGEARIFAFYYQDVIDFRANVVRRHWQTKPDRQSAGFFDASLWESAKRTGPTSLKRLINSALEGTSATCVLIGSETYERPWVRYEILKSFSKGNSIIGVHINSIKGKDERTKLRGPNPLEYVGVSFSASGDTGTLWEKINGAWKEYAEIDGSASYRTGGVEQQCRGNGYNLGQWYPVYDWMADDGYNNFSTWIG